MSALPNFIEGVWFFLKINDAKHACAMYGKAVRKSFHLEILEIASDNPGESPCLIF